MTYDHWKTTEPEYGQQEQENRLTDEEHFVEHITYLEGRIGHYRAALLKIVGWKGFAPTDNPEGTYKEGANDMLCTLKQMVEEALG